jgi:hypothetical protein
MADRNPPSTLFERLGAGVFPNRDGKGLGPTLGPGLSPEHQRELVDRALGEPHPLSDEARMRRAEEALEAGAEADLSDDSDLDAHNELESERLVHARCQSGPEGLKGH